MDFDDTGEVEGIESFTDFMTSFVKGTSIYQFLANLKAGLKYVLHTGQLVNNGLCNTPGKYPLDAAYGKSLQDQINELNTGMHKLDYSNTINVLPSGQSSGRFSYTAPADGVIFVDISLSAGEATTFSISGVTVIYDTNAGNRGARRIWPVTMAAGQTIVCGQTLSSSISMAAATNFVPYMTTG